MPLRRRHRKSLNIPGHAHELTFSCYHRYRFLSRERTRRWLAEAIDEARCEHDFALWAYVFMPEHVHLILFPRQSKYDISIILRDIKQPVSRRAVAYLRKHRPDWLGPLTRRRGKRTERLFWQSGGGYDRNIDRFETLEKMVDYAHENPVRRGLVARAVDYHWSSARWYAGLADGPIQIDPIE